VASGRIVFFGTAAVCLPFLAELHAGFSLTRIITQPDATGGRHHRSLVPPVRTFADRHGIPVHQPESLRDPSLAELLRQDDIDLGVVIAYGRLIPEAIIGIPRHRIVNVHFSLLPAYRGAAPVARALENGERQTGISVFEIERRLDAGPVWSQLPVAIAPDETAGELTERLGRLGAPFLLATIRQILAGATRPIPQAEERATLAPMLTKAEGRIDWNLPAGRLADQGRAFSPWPGQFTEEQGRRIRVSPPRALAESTDLPPGTVIRCSATGLDVACGAGTVLRIAELQPEGKKPMPPLAYSLGHPLPDRLR